MNGNNKYSNSNRYDNSGRYDDIIHLPHHVSKTHPQMSVQDRAAQFSPFAALTGYNATILEAARTTEDFIELDEDKRTEINETLQLLKRCLSDEPPITATYFKPDGKKDGGAYVSVTGRLKKIDEFHCALLLTDGQCIPIKNLFDLQTSVAPPSFYPIA